MRFPLFIATRYLVSRKKQNAINIISGISVTGVLVGTFALILVLSIFNGFDQVVRSLFSSFDPELKILPASGKRFEADGATLKMIEKTDGVAVYAKVIEENVLLKYNEKTHPARIKAVDNHYMNVTGLDTMINRMAPEQPKNGQFCIVGQGLSYFLGVNLNFARSIRIFAPNRESSLNVTARNAFRQNYIIPSAIFSIRQEIDEKYVIVPLEFASELFQTGNEISAIELKTHPHTDIDEVKADLQERLGPDFVVKNRYEQHEFFYKVMKSEKWAIFLILSFILVIASFNILGSLTMLIIDKKHDMFILQSMGADNKLIRKIFIAEGFMITFVGAITGLLLGFIIAWLQQTYSLIKISTQGTLIIDAYPVDIQAIDFVWVLVVVALIGFIASYIPVRLLTRRILK
ncbi:Lipoprotein-releasing system transmembrane protein LolE [Salinivirga cyanobacteriivorans]|uniref:Lipoprotein-releasing system transmembrane protein LolE n=1 Tax=Salinivirga cyanobacteriivorans TaxID=1307839 RepID=A0A0S2I0C5_9BACT|nr:FtsX-like permease family protein [Salinivirga cyanobacteriivorans]ALO15811.1 Lipoprotein-releasing system transmembrane protein LolE [Salinivirga cyanobacteriivorans]